MTINISKVFSVLLIWAILPLSLVYASPNPGLISILKRQIGVDKRVTVTFKDTEIQDILRFFSSEYQINTIAGPEVTGALSFNFKNVHPLDAFDAVISSQGFDWYKSGRIFKVISMYPIKVVHLNYIQANEAVISLKPLVLGKGVISANKQNNSILIRAPQGDLMTILSAIRSMDIPPLQVLVEARIVEISHDTSLSYGMNLGYLLTGEDNVRTTGFANLPGANLTGFFAQAVDNNFSANLEALIRQSKINTIANPKILTLNHKSASIITGQRLGFRTTTTTGTSIQEQVDFLEVGTKLTITPHISRNGEIIMEIFPEVSDGHITEDGLPNEVTTEASTTVMVRDGQSILIGGMVRQKKVSTKTGVPILGDIPILDLFFSKREITTEQTDIVVIIKPTIVRPDELKDVKLYLKQN
ncbi:MAG: hypothetical protein HRT90_11950 [Candidatus Margulisbacteria bacterium]|nr:hypothetical protein [Candidatus Margulisiibacteriota bacterium]